MSFVSFVEFRGQEFRGSFVDRSFVDKEFRGQTELALSQKQIRGNYFVPSLQRTRCIRKPAERIINSRSCS
jgi:hypothetical protein